MEMIPLPPAGTPEGHALVHRDINPIVDVWRGDPILLSPEGDFQASVSLAYRAAVPEKGSQA